MRHVLSVNDFKKEDIEEIFRCVSWVDKGFYNHMGERIAPNADKVMATLFFEPSTRTKMSFQSAMYRLGGKVIDLPASSSQKKGETDLDTVKTVAEYADVLIIRHPQEVMEALAASITTPIISAGEGSAEHPTQALLDLYTIRKYRQANEITIMFTGDLYYSRTVQSLVTLLKREEYSVKFLFTNKCNPTLANLSNTAFNFTDEKIIPEALKTVDVVYMTRPQKERWMNGGRLPEGEPSKFIMTKGLAQTMKSNAIIMHPLPRNEEIHPDVDALPQAKYFDQVRNGLFVRMALLHYMIWK